MEPRANVRLGPLTTLEVGGPAAYLWDVVSTDELREAFAWARRKGLPTLVLSGGSNMLISDSGYPGLIIRPVLRDLRVGNVVEGRARVHAGAGIVWDELVAMSVDRNLAGIECMSGIPGWVGAAPVQNIGAYGQELSDVCVRVRAFDRREDRELDLEATECGFGYRDSRFKSEEPNRYVITAVELELTDGGPPTLAYRDLQQRFQDDAEPALCDVREAVLEIRRSKSMVHDPGDPNHRSAGSFFTNPIVPERIAETVTERAQERFGADIHVPIYPASRDGSRPGERKLAAAWLIERAGFAKGTRRGSAAISTNHTLALTNTGDASAAEIIDLAAEIRDGVWDAWGVELHPEPVWIGFDADAATLLARRRS